MTTDERPAALRSSNNGSSSNNNNNSNSNNSCSKLSLKQQQQQQHRSSQWHSRPCSPVQSAAWCQACHQPIADRYFLQVGDCLYHGGCLRCQHCQRCLETAGSCFAREGKIFCRDDYFNLFSARQSCSRCGLSLNPADLVMKAREHHFHLACFTCHWPACERRFSPGDEFGLSVSGAVFCRFHLQHQQLVQAHPPPPPQFILGDSSAEVEISTTKVDTAGGKQARGGKGRPRKTSAKKSADVPPQTQLPTALHHQEELGIVQQHHLHQQIACSFDSGVVKEELVTIASSAAATTTVTLASALSSDAMDLGFVSGVFGVGGDPLEQLGSEMASDACCHSPNSASSGCGGAGGGDGVGGGSGASGVGDGGASAAGGSSGTPGQRQKRVRTSFKHHQLRTMKSYFIINHNPDSKDLKQLAQKTGLSKRVLQVWFQNARAKYRRSLLKQQQQPPPQQQLQQPQQQQQQQQLDEAAHAMMSGAAAAGHQKSASLHCHAASASPDDLSDLSSTGSVPEFSHHHHQHHLHHQGQQLQQHQLLHQQAASVSSAIESAICQQPAGLSYGSGGVGRDDVGLSGGDGGLAVSPESPSGGDYFSMHNVNCLA